MIKMAEWCVLFLFGYVSSTPLHLISDFMSSRLAYFVPFFAVHIYLTRLQCIFRKFVRLQQIYVQLYMHRQKKIRHNLLFFCHLIKFGIIINCHKNTYNHQRLVSLRAAYSLYTFSKKLFAFRGRKRNEYHHKYCVLSKISLFIWPTIFNAISPIKYAVNLLPKV